MRERVLKIVSYSGFILLCCCVFWLNGRSQAAAPPVQLYSPYTRIAVSPGKTIDYSVQIINNSSSIQTVPVAVTGLPRSWTHTLKSGSWDISRISVLPKGKQTVSLSVAVPLKVNKGAYRFHLDAGEFGSLPFTVEVSRQGSYKTAFSSKQPSLEGAANTTFTFNASLENQTADTQLYALRAEPPPGWDVTFKANYKQVASVSVDANHTQSITITINPPDQVPAGKYEIPVFATTPHTSAALELETVITGSYAMELTTPTGLLSTDITAGDQKRIPLSVKNTGSAALKKISMSFTAPEDWDVSFDPKSIDMLPPGRTAQVFATIKASKDAIAGDYDANLQAKTPETSSKAAFRVSVRTPLLWGWIGVVIILLAIGSVYYLFRKYGRR